MKEFKPGNLVYWVETYSDDIPKDGGSGVVLAIRDFPDLKYRNYLVYRDKYKDKMIFESHNLHVYPNTQIQKGE